MIGTHIEIILIFTGATTAMALAQFIAPASVSRIIYGAAPTEVVGITLVRHWGILVFLVGVLLIYAAFHPAVREPVTVVAAVEKNRFRLGYFWHVLTALSHCSSNRRGGYPHRACVCPLSSRILDASRSDRRRGVEIRRRRSRHQRCNS